MLHVFIIFLVLKGLIHRYAQVNHNLNCNNLVKMKTNKGYKDNTY